MKKIFFSIVALLCIGLSVQAQEVFHRGTSVVNLGLGIGEGGYSQILLPPLSVSYDHGVVDGLLDGKASIGVGGYFGTTVHNSTSGSILGMLIGPRASFHYQFVNKLDTYLAPMLGYAFVNTSVDHYRVSSGSFFLGLDLGARYYFTPQWAIMGEIGTGFAFFTIGAAYRF